MQLNKMAVQSDNQATIGDYIQCIRCLLIVNVHCWVFQVSLNS